VLEYQEYHSYEGDRAQGRRYQPTVKRVLTVPSCPTTVKRE